MLNKALQERDQIPLWLIILLILSLILGIFLRFYHLEQKVYSFDETFSSTYIYGQQAQAYTNFDGAILNVGELKKYVFIDFNKTLIQSIEQVIKKVYVFPPLYPILAIVWSYLLHNWYDHSLVIQRSLGALLSVIALMGVYWLGIELFRSKTIALIAVVLLAISPFHLQYAQIIRPYSILSATTVIGCACLLKAIHVKKLFWWRIYGLSLVIGLYSHILFGFVLVGHMTYVFINEKWKIFQNLTAFFLTVGISSLLFFPWIWTYISSPMLAYSVDQVGGKNSLWQLISAWVKGIQNIFIDLYNPFFTPNLFKLMQWFFAPLVLAIAVISVYTLWRYAPTRVKNFLLALAIATGISLMFKDVVTGSSISSRMRYMIPFALAIELIVAYQIGSWLTANKSARRRWGQFAISVLLVCGISSCLTISQAKSWDAVGSPHFPKIAQIISSADHPLVLCTNLDRALSMSYLVDSDTKFKLIKDNLVIPDGFDVVFLLEPSSQVFQKLAANYQIVKTYPQGRLFQVDG